jgi:hypothetical protein
MKIVDTTTQEITAADALAKFEYKHVGLIVQIHGPEKKASVLVYGAHNDTIEGGRCAGLWTLACDHYGRWSTQSEGAAEVLRRAMEGSGELHYFETLADFARAVLANGWK